METVIVDTFVDFTVLVVEVHSYVSAILGMVSFLCGVELWRVFVRSISSREVL